VVYHLEDTPVGVNIGKHIRIRRMTIRLIMWSTVYLLLLGTCSIRAEYSDGLVIKLKGWLLK